MTWGGAGGRWARRCSGRPGPGCDLALTRGCVLCQEHCKSGSLIWSGNFSAWGTSGGRKRASPLGQQRLGSAREGPRPWVTLLLLARVGLAAASGGGVPLALLRPPSRPGAASGSLPVAVRARGCRGGQSRAASVRLGPGPRCPLAGSLCSLPLAFVESCCFLT